MHLPYRANALLNVIIFAQSSINLCMRKNSPSLPASKPCESWKAGLSLLWKISSFSMLWVSASLKTLDWRIFWCPTGPLRVPSYPRSWPLRRPVLGARTQGIRFRHLIITLSILVPPRNQDTNPSRGFRLPAVPQPSSDGQVPLPGVHVELEHIRAIIRNSPSAQTTLVEPSVGTIEEVLAQMKEAHQVHFACHGIQGEPHRQWTLSRQSAPSETVGHYLVVTTAW
jgi:hypothetical protein